MLSRAGAKLAELAAGWNMPLCWAGTRSGSDAWSVETAWCWYFYYEVAAVDGEEPEELFGGGPIVVNKDGTGVWLMNSSHPFDQLLAYAEEHGYAVDSAWR